MIKLLVTFLILIGIYQISTDLTVSSLQLSSVTSLDVEQEANPEHGSCCDKVNNEVDYFFMNDKEFLLKQNYYYSVFAFHKTKIKNFVFQLKKPPKLSVLMIKT